MSGATAITGEDTIDRNPHHKEVLMGLVKYQSELESAKDNTYRSLFKNAKVMISSYDPDQVREGVLICQALEEKIKSIANTSPALSPVDINTFYKKVAKLLHSGQAKISSGKI